MGYISVRIFISGGCKNGKSYYAQRIAKAQCAESGLYYIATMAPVDTEDDERITRHRRERCGFGFATVEQPVDIENILLGCNRNGSFLLDSVTALLFNEMLRKNGNPHENPAAKTLVGLMQVINEISNIVVVSDYIYSDALIYEPFTENYRKNLSEIDRAAAKSCNVVLEAVYSNLTVHKGREVFGHLYEKVL